MIRVRRELVGYCNACRKNRQPSLEIEMSVKGAGGGLVFTLCRKCAKILLTKVKLKLIEQAKAFFSTGEGSSRLRSKPLAKNPYGRSRFRFK